MPLSRLVKSRSNGNVVQPDETKEERLPRHSIADLKTRRVVTTQRQLLHRQFSDTYADSLGSSAFLDGSEQSLPFLNRTASSSILNQQIDATSLPTVTPKASIDAVQPFGAPGGKLDIEQAINMLQELKKTASPEELVSLHRALLPMKEVYSSQAPSADDTTFSGSVPPDRRRSVMPPGLATRNGLSDDVLRKPQYSATVHTPSRERREMWVHTAERASATPPIRGRQTGMPGPSSARPETPFEQPNTGSYHPGTLRITNGAASPEPSIISKLAATADVHDQDERANLETSADVNVGRCIQQSERRRPNGPRDSQQNSWAMEKAKTEAEAGERQRSPPVSKRSVETRRFSFDQAVSLPTSPSAPRFQQRWSHRAMHLSQQYLMDCEIGESPFGQSTADLELANRLSSVRDVENDDPSSFDDAHAQAMFQLTGDTTPVAHAEEGASVIPATHGTEHVSQEVNLEPPARVLRKVDSGYGSDIPMSPHREQPLQHPIELPVQGPQTPRDEQKDRSTSAERPFLHGNTSMYTFKEILGAPQPTAATDTPSTDMNGKRTSPLSFFKSRNKVPKKSSSVMLNDETSLRPGLAHSMSSPSTSELAKEPKRLQKRVPEAIRRQRQLEAGNRNAIHDSTGSIAPDESTNLTTERTSTDTPIQLAPGQDTQTAIPDTTEDANHRFRLRSKSFGRKRSKTNASEHNIGAVLHTPAFRSRNRRSISVSGSTICPESDGKSGSNCLTSGGQKQQTTDQMSSDPQSVARALTSHPLHPSTETKRSIPLPKSMQPRQQTSTGNIARSSATYPIAQNAVENLPRDVPMPNAPPRPFAALEGAQRVIPIGGHGSVEDLFPEWHSRPAAAPSPSSTPSPAHLQVRQSHKPRNQHQSVSSIPPLPEFPADIESKVHRADQMVAKMMMNSPRNSARNSPLPSARSSEDSPSNVARRPALKPTISQTNVTEDIAIDDIDESARWSGGGTIALPHADCHSKPASPTHDSQHPGWPGWEKQAELWRQRKIGLGHDLKRSVDMSGKILVESESSPPSPSIVVSRYITPLGSDTTRNVEHADERVSSAGNLAQAYTYLLADDQENRPAQQNVQRTDSVDSTATYESTSSDGRAAKLDISRTGSAYSTSSTVASSTTSTAGASLDAVVGKPATYEPTQPFIPYRPADAVRAERSRALSLARRSCNIPTGSFEPVPSMPQNKSTSMLDRYSGGLGYGWDRSTGFGGSAGTRSSGTESANRKSVKISEDYGLDLSDIPVFLRKA